MEHFEKYEEYTGTQNWADLCKLNDVKLDSFGTKKELRVLSEYLDPGEVVFALTSGVMTQTDTSNTFDFGANTWLVVLTNDRFLFLDSAMLTSSVDTQSVRHNKVQAVSASQGLLLGKIIIDLGSRTLVIDNCNKSTVKVIANLANKWLKEIEKESSVSHITVSYGTMFDKLEFIDKIFNLGAISEEEFNIAKEKILESDEFKEQKEKLLSSII